MQQNANCRKRGKTLGLSGRRAADVDGLCAHVKTLSPLLRKEEEEGSHNSSELLVREKKKVR